MQLRKPKLRELLLIKLKKLIVTRSARSIERRKPTRKLRETLEKLKRNIERSRTKLMKR